MISEELQEKINQIANITQAALDEMKTYKELVDDMENKGVDKDDLEYINAWNMARVADCIIPKLLENIVISTALGTPELQKYAVMGIGVVYDATIPEGDSSFMEECGLKPIMTVMQEIGLNDIPFTDDLKGFTHNQCETWEEYWTDWTNDAEEDYKEMWLKKYMPKDFNWLDWKSNFI